VYLLLPWIALALFVCSAALWQPMPRSRGRFRSAFGFLGLWVIFQAGTSAVSLWHLSFPAARQVALALIALAAVQVIAGVVFDFAVEKARVPRFAGEIVVVACYILILFNLFYSLGVNVTGIFATSAVATAVIGLSLQDMLGNIASGIALEFENDIQVGDFIKCGDSAGWVQHVRLRHTSIETPDGDRVMLPNSFLTRSPVMVLSRSRRRFIPFMMPYSINPQELTDTVTAALRASPIPDVAADPAPFCVVREMASGHIQYAAVVWMLRPGQETTTVSAVLNRIYFALRRAGTPVTEITNLLELKAATAGSGATANPVDVLRLTPIFRLLDDPGLFELGARLHHLSFAPGEIIIRQGDAGDSMYFVTSGQVEINYAGHDRSEIRVAVISPGEFFGESSLLTGETRNASAIALSRVDCYKLDKAGLQGIMTRNPDLAEDMSAVMAHRLTELDITREKLGVEAARLREAESQMQLLSLIRRFFGLKSNSAKA
jgi:small-conductance mechanosensitive channel/CRP-like cAMP-binding protein